MIPSNVSNLSSGAREWMPTSQLPLPPQVPEVTPEPTDYSLLVDVIRHLF